MVDCVGRRVKCEPWSLHRCGRLRAMTPGLLCEHGAVLCERVAQQDFVTPVDG